MPDKTDDPNFMQAMHDLLGLDKDAAETVLGELDGDELNDLTDALIHGDRILALAAVHKYMPDQNDAPLNHGDEVRTPEGTGTVSVPHGPHNTVGVIIDGELQMVDQGKVTLKNKKIKEAVIGMAMMPELMRMRELAGLPPDNETMEMPTDTTVSISDIPDEAPSNPGEKDGNSAACDAFAALDALEAALPNVRMRDLRDIRRRLTGITQSLNESQDRLRRPTATPRPRKA